VVKWRPGKEASLAPPCSNLSIFGSKCLLKRFYGGKCLLNTVHKYCLLNTVTQSTCSIVGTFQNPRSDSTPLAMIRRPMVISRPVNCYPLPRPRYAPDPNPPLAYAHDSNYQQVSLKEWMVQFQKRDEWGQRRVFLLWKAWEMHVNDNFAIA